MDRHTVLTPLRHVMFDLGALPYAFLTAQPAWRAHGGELATLTHVHAGDRVLDLGSGPGESAFGMAERVPGLRVVGLDASGSMVSIARLRQKIPGNTRGDVSFLEGDAMALPFPAGSFDAVVGHSFLYLVPDADRVLAETARVLRPGGRCAFLEPTPHAGALLPPEITRRALREPRFVTSMALWRVVSQGYGRFDEKRFREAFTRAGLTPQDFRPTLGGLGLFGTALRA